jgi:hypothetical protein
LAQDISQESYNVKSGTKVKSLRAYSCLIRTIVTRLVEQFRFAHRRHSSYDFWRDSDFVASGFKFDPNETQKSDTI